MEIVVKVPPWTPRDAVVYLAGNRRELGQWRPDGVRLKRQRDGIWFGTARVPEGETFEFKVTLGRWDNAEKDCDGRDLPNRRMVATGERAVVEVQSWGRPCGPASTVTGELHPHERFYSHALGNWRTVWVWLPPGYAADSEKTYPVVYMHDGQNLFDAARASFGVEWGVDEAMTAGIAAGRIRPAIIVGVENTVDRFGEYTPTSAGGVGGRGPGYAKFLLGEVKPFIEKYYRVEGGPENTYTIGSSLGGLISLYLLREHADEFGGCGALSPSLWWDAENLLKAAERDARWSAGKKIWIDTGTEEHGWGEEGCHIQRVRRMEAALKKAGLTNFLRTVVDEGAEHNEAAWSKRIGPVLEHLLGS